MFWFQIWRLSTMSCKNTTTILYFELKILTSSLKSMSTEIACIALSSRIDLRFWDQTFYRSLFPNQYSWKNKWACCTFPSNHINRIWAVLKSFNDYCYKTLMWTKICRLSQLAEISILMFRVKSFQRTSFIRCNKQTQFVC